MNAYARSQENLDLLRAEDDSDMWIAYVDYVDEMVVDGFFTAIQCSLKFLLDNTSPRPEAAPLFEAVLELQVILTEAKNFRLQFNDKTILRGLLILWSASNSLALYKFVLTDGLVDLLTAFYASSLNVF